MTEKNGTSHPGSGKRDSIPRTRDEAYETALDLARQAWAEADFETQCRRAGAVVRTDMDRHSAELIFLGQPYLISHPDGLVCKSDEPSEVSLPNQVLLLHYLTGADGRAPTGRSISYQEVPDARLYYPNFIKRTTGILKSVFRDDMDALHQAALSVGGKPAEAGDMGVLFQPLPHVSFTLVIWKGDEEFSPEMNIIFDESITGYLPAEDIIVLAGMISINIMKAFHNK